MATQTVPEGAFVERLQQRVVQLEQERDQLRTMVELLAIDCHHERHHAAVFTECTHKPCTDVLNVLGCQP